MKQRAIFRLTIFRLIDYLYRLDLMDHASGPCQSIISMDYTNADFLRFSTFRTITVGFGFTPNLLAFPHLKKGKALAGLDELLSLILTAGGDLHPAPRK